GFCTGLFLIALGSGGIKPLVVSFCGDQFDQSNKDKAKLVFDAFYWIINFGSFFALLFAPLVLRHFGPAVAFGVPGVLMFIATVVFLMGLRQYLNVPPSGMNPDSFLNVIRTALREHRAGEEVAWAMVACGCIVAAALSLALWALVAICVGLPWTDASGFVISACLALGVMIAFGALSASLQLEGTCGLHRVAAVDGVRAVLP